MLGGRPGETPKGHSDGQAPARTQPPAGAISSLNTCALSCGFESLSDRLVLLVEGSAIVVVQLAFTIAVGPIVCVISHTPADIMLGTQEQRPKRRVRAYSSA